MATEKKQYKYFITADCEVEIFASNKKEALEKTREKLKGLEIWSFKVNTEKRTFSQNKALHLLFKQLSEKCLEKGIEMRDIVKDEIPIECTPENLKWLWKKLQYALFKKKSTTKLKKFGDIEIVYDTFNKILIERTKGEISLPPFPDKEILKKKYKIDYPEGEYNPAF